MPLIAFTYDEYQVRFYAFQYLMVKSELVDDVTELSVKVSCKRSKLGNLHGSKVTNQRRLFKVMVEGGK